MQFYEDAWLTQLTANETCPMAQINVEVPIYSYDPRIHENNQIIIGLGPLRSNMAGSTLQSPFTIKEMRFEQLTSDSW